MTTSRVTPGSRHTFRRVAATALVSAALLGTGGAAAVAAPPPSGPTCAQVLALAAKWPGSTRVEGRVVRLYSDAYASHLASTSACAPSGD